ncbi:Ku70/Ku80 beta-barrel domain-containing protein [Naegleria gruberi]|uniref:Ku70/Ku80 beta-barrel domain-containing protein n=1 Tax=Naegleria gruberi TaxID=5762 RepID=D2VUC7_NAEGR|nr:Ku70/Ku80 beta-barrel domain-containing protein [Naegleria gruberi]EFC39669.1 Ku70/Ku80 beta-barrel domain-containing protein [Naegleria gruberi]|eukprot:XP_002672413.1 Ku70/Ku80 beta-barrel domain-containing protein [Naegleria gruberi strain NEG-M]
MSASSVAPPPAKEALVIIFDVGKSLGTRSRDEFEKAKRAITLLIKMKMRYSPKDEVGFVLVGTKKTKNHLNDEYEGEYENIYIEQAIDTVSLDLFKIVDSINIDTIGMSPEGDLFDAVIVATDMIKDRCGKRKYAKRIVIVSDAGGTEISVDNDTRENIYQGMRNQDVKVNVIGLDFVNTEVKLEDDNGKIVGKTPKLRNEIFLCDMCKNVGGIVIPIQQAIDTLLLFKSKKVLSRTTFRGNLDIAGNIKIPVWVYKKTEKTSLPTAKRLSLVSRRANTGGDGDVQMERCYYSYDDPDNQIEKDKTVKAYKYGKNFVPFNIVNEKALKYKSSKGITVLGFTDEKNIDRSHFMAETYSFIAKPDDPFAQIALSSFIRALSELEMVMIITYVYRDDLEPKLGFLYPHIGTNSECLYFNALPFAEDIREYPFKSFSTVKHSEEQLQAAEDLIKSMDLMDADEDENGEKSEAMKPTCIYNPLVQHFYDCLHVRALKPNDPLPPVEPLITKFCYPEMNPESFYYKLMEKTKEHRLKFKSLFPTKEVEADSKLGKRKYWFAMGENEITLDSYNLEEVAENVQGTALLESDHVGQVVKRLKDGAYDGMSDAQFNEVQQRVGLNNLFMEQANSVKTTNPTKDFSEMLNRKDVDMVDKAIQEMQVVIFKLVNDSIEDQYYEKVLACIKTLREGCIREAEPNQFNNFLKKLKQSYSKGKREDFWCSFIVQNNISLITQDECDESEVTEDEAKKFLTEAVIAAVIQEESEDEKIGDNDLFDQLE